MTSADVVLALLRMNLDASAAIALALALRGRARRWFGPHLAYRLWLIVPVAALGAFAPGPANGPASALVGDGKTWLLAGAHARLLVALWAAGAVASAILAFGRQLSFAAAERAGRAGPAVVGIIAPRLVAPRDIAARYSVEERRLIRAHELAHMVRGYTRWNAVATLASWISWFNPLAHVALRLMRFDQEMACDATVLETGLVSRRAYAQTLLRASSAGPVAPFARLLSSRGRSLETRIRTLLHGRTPQRREDAGLAGLAGVCLTMFAAAWACQPPYAARALRESVVQIDFGPPPPTLTMRIYQTLPEPARDD
jgi:beta-lactamase regulating signal transducer with metallopeptidase domain